MISCTEWLFFHAWKLRAKRSCPGVEIPRTIIYKEGQPYAEYSTNNNNTLLRRGKNHLDNEAVLAAFEKSELVLLLKAQHYKSDGRQNCEQLLYEYCTPSHLKEILLSQQRPQNMISN